MTSEATATARLLRQRAASGELWLPITGSSMGRRYRDCARVLVTPLARPPRIGEVWVFCRDDAAILAHRFVRRRGDRFVFRGDARPSSDAPVPADRLVGVVTLVDDGTRPWAPRQVHAIVPLARIALSRLQRAVRR